MPQRSALSLAGCLTLAALAALANPPATATAPGADRASAPATAASYPSPALRAASEQVRRTWQEKLDGTFRAVVEPPFVIFGNLPAEDLEAYARRCVIAPAEAMWASYFTRRPNQPLTVFLFRDAPTYQDWAGKLFGDQQVPHFGYYRPGLRVMVMNIATGGGTLVHELTHPLLQEDFPDVPCWFNEGLASLHEGCSVRPEGIVGLLNWRLPGLQKALADGTLGSLKDLVTTADFRGGNAGLHYAHARYFVMFMQKKGLLPAFYRQFRDHPEGADAAVEAIEKVFGQDLEAVEVQFRAWVKPLRYEPPRR